MKKYKQLIYSLIFIGLSFAMLFFISNFLRDRQTTLSAMYSEEDYTLDALIVGSSHVNNGYMPNILWEENNISACNVYSWSQPMWTSYHYIKESLKTQSPKVIVLEMYGMMYGHSYIQPSEIDKTNYATSFNIDIGLNYFQLIQTAENVGIEITPYEEFLNLPRYHTRWKMLFDLESYNPHEDRDFLKGYGITFQNNEALENPNIKTDTVFTPYEFSVEYLNEIVELCRSEEIELIFTLVPYVYNEREVEISNWIENYAKENNIEFYNYLLEDGDRINFNYSEDLSDNGHLNYYGAKKVTEDLSDILKNYLDIKKEDNLDYINLNEDYKKYERVIKANNVMTQNDLNEYIKLALEGEYTMFIANSGANLNDEFFKILLDAGININQNKTNFTLGINVDGENIINQDIIEFNLFNSDGDVKFDTLNENAKIYLNDVEVLSNESNFKIVLYDNILERPLETVALNGEVLSHKEFTSDIIGLFKK